MKTIVLGPPGTGKTHTLLEQVETYLKNTDPDKIGYFAFTKKASNEAKERAMKKFNYSEDDLPYFRTLHSLAFQRLGWDKTKDSFIAGDDDQAIFRWAGADVDSFITQKGKIVELKESVRVPKIVHEFANKIINRIKNRLPKNWNPKAHKGALSRYWNFEDIDMNNKNWLVLTRTRYQLNALEEILKEKGLYFENRFKKSYEKYIQEAALNWERLRKGQLLLYKDIVNISQYMSPINWDKDKLKALSKEAPYGIDQLTQGYGLNTKETWHECFDNAGSKRITYIKKMRANGEKLNKEARIKLSTIHSVKGGEEDNVVILPDFTANTQLAYERNKDDENRLFYVGATRAKKHLHIVKPKDENKAFPMDEI